MKLIPYNTTLHGARTASNAGELALKTKAKNHFSSSGLRRLASGVLGIAALALAIGTASAQNGANADAAYHGFLSAYLMTTNEPTHNYPLPYICQSLNNHDLAFMWQQAYMISGMEDAFDKNYLDSTRRQLVNDLLNSFVVQNITNLTWDGWNDDIEWACIALAHGYQETGNVNFLNAATLNWNAVWSRTRGWDTKFGGGIWENTSTTTPSKCTLSNAPFIIAGCMLYRITGNSTYLTESEQSYAWMRSELFDTSTGQVNEGIADDGSTNGKLLASNNSYNSGIFLNAANSLYKITGNAQYYNDALLAASWVVNNHTVMTEDHPNNGPFGSEEFFRALSLFAVENNLWATYYPWLEANCTAAWNHRRTDYNITWNNYNANTPTTNLLAMEAISSVIVQAVTQISPIVGPHSIRNFVSDLSVDNTMSTAQGAGVEQWGWNGGSQQLWDFRQNSDSTWTIKCLYSGDVLDDPGSSTVNGKQMDQWPSNGGSNQKWVLTQQSNGAYLIQNQASGKVLDNDNKSTNGTPLVQWDANGGNNQLWNLK